MNLGVGALIAKDNQVLLLLRKMSPEKGKWSIPGGKVEQEETPDQALLRELKEELGTEAQLPQYLGAFLYRSIPDNFEGLSLLFLAVLEGVPNNVEDAVHADIQWFDLNSLPENLAQPAKFAITRLKQIDFTKEYPVEEHSSVDVVLVQPFFPLADKESLSLPLGLASIHSVLKQEGYKIKTWDCSLPDDYTQFYRQLPVVRPKIVGIQFHSDMSFGWAKRTCSFVRTTLPDAIIVAGGELATSKSRILLENRYADIVVRGEGEITFLEIVKAVFRQVDLNNVDGIDFFQKKTNKIISTKDRNSILNLDILPLPEIADFSWERYGQWTLFTSRGCPFKCIYCSSAAYWKHTIRYHSPERVVTEISRLVHEFGASDIYIADDTFTLNKKRVYAVCSQLLAQDIHVRWSCLTRADCVDESLLREMHKAGCVLISFGVETINQDTLDKVKKTLSFERVEKTLRLCTQTGIQTRVSLIIGLPGETEEHVLSTLNFLIRTQPNEIQIYGLTPHDGTVLYENLSELGVRIIEKDSSLWSRNVLKPVCETQELSKEQIISLARKFVGELQQVGYVYLNEEMPRKKIGALKTVATSFSPVQAIKSLKE